MSIQTQQQAIRDCIQPAMDEAGFEIVQIRMTDGKKRKTLQISLDTKAGEGITVDQCAKASRTISELLDVEDIISGEYNLEVGSPGIDRPLSTAEQFERYIGFEAKIETSLPIEGRRRFPGVLRQVKDNAVVIGIDGVDHIIPLSNIANAKLKLTDALIKAEQARRKGNTH